MEPTLHLRPLERVATGIPGLDRILRGGFLQGGIYTITGAPGTGKTILANQICFHHVASGGRVVYVTVLAELHTRMLSHLQTLTFFDVRPIGDALYYVNGYQALIDHGLTGLLDLVRQAIRTQQASVVVLDGLATALAVAESPLHFERFIQQLHAFVDLVGCTAVLVTARDMTRAHPEDTMVDGLLELTDQPFDLRVTREVEVRKWRGTGYLRGRHSFRITDRGIQVHPRTEALLAAPDAVATVNRVRLAFGISAFDQMLEGGLLSSSTTMIQGPPGCGKTLLGLHFLAAGARVGEPGVHFGFYETPTRLLDKAVQVGLDLSSFATDGLIDIVWQSPLEEILDVLAERVLEAVQRHQARRLFIDGLNGFESTAVYPERLTRFFTALTHELRRRGVTTLFTAETHNLYDPALEVPIRDLSAVVENIVFLRYVQDAHRFARVISILKLRESSHDPTLRPFTITDTGIHLATADDIPPGAPARRRRGP